MKILLIGEYSNLHNTLKKGLIALGHEVTIAGFSDGFKKYPIDIAFEKKYQTGITSKIKNLIYSVTRLDLNSYYIKKEVLKNETKLSGYDIVQFINENTFHCTPKIEQVIFDFIRQNNKHTFLLSSGDDFISNHYNYDKKQRRYSMFTPYFEGKISKKELAHSFKYLKKSYKKLHQHIFKHIKGVIASDLDYHIPLENHPKYLGLVPNAINYDELTYIPPLIEDKIIIFHGINTGSYYKKGNDIFEEALDIIHKNYGDKVKIITTRSIPYKEYINSYNKCHILLDQVYAYDQGYNALEAMAKGKVVFTGAEQEWLNYYKLEKDTVTINALPNAQKIATKLGWLIENPNKIIEIAKNARLFIEQHHDYKKSAQLYLDKWLSKM